MKRLIALLLAAVMCLALVACGSNEPEDDGNEMQIVGTWKSGNLTQVFKDDHTGTIMNSSGITFACSWSYSKGVYTIEYSMGDLTATITEKNGSLVMTYSGLDYSLVEAE